LEAGAGPRAGPGSFFGGEKNFLNLLGFAPCIIQPVTILIMVPQLNILIYKNICVTYFHEAEFVL
jgi:hypothetical protein